MKGGSGGEIVQVEGGHIIRATGRKDRHSKVYTAKGPRDRRVRLSAHTAIQFYDVQDRLGYDRPSKAVDWLIKKAKTAIDKLAELPPWDPNGIPQGVDAKLEHHSETSSRYEFQLGGHLGKSVSGDSSGYSMPPPPPPQPQPGDGQSIGDTMKSFFPMSTGTLMNFQDYPQDMMPRAGDLGLSLHTNMQSHERQHSTEHQALLSGSGPMTFEQSYPRFAGWNGDSRIGYIFNAQALAPAHHQLFGQQGAAFSQREPLQSNNYSQMLHSWDERQLSAAEPYQAFHQSSSAFASEFRIPARIHGQEDEDEDAMESIGPSSMSPNSHP